MKKFHLMVHCFAILLLFHPTVSLPTQSSAQRVDEARLPSETDINDMPDTNPITISAPDVSVITRDAYGIVDEAIRLVVDIVAQNGVSIKAIRLFGLPPDMLVTDLDNEFSSRDNSYAVDVSSWDLHKIYIAQLGKRENSFELIISALWSRETDGRSETSSSKFNVTFSDPNHNLGTIRKNNEMRENTPAKQVETETQTKTLVRRPSAGADPSPPDVFLAEAPPRPQRQDASSVDHGASAGAGRAPNAETQIATSPQGTIPPRPPKEVDPLVERAKGLIRLGDISGARLLLERAQARNAPNATFLLAQTWDPAMLRAWKVRGLRADPDLARSLYAKAADQGHVDERRLAATER
ncbi:hypothetical protein [Methylobacterium sp. CM6257]